MKPELREQIESLWNGLNALESQLNQLKVQIGQITRDAAIAAAQEDRAAGLDQPTAQQGQPAARQGQPAVQQRHPSSPASGARPASEPPPIPPSSPAGSSPATPTPAASAKAARLVGEMYMPPASQTQPQASLTQAGSAQTQPPRAQTQPSGAQAQQASAQPPRAGATPPPMPPAMASQYAARVPGSPPQGGSSAAPREGLEQRLGVNWMSRAGIVVLLLGVGFFFQYAAREGWISPLVRVIIAAVGGAVFVGLGELTLRRGLRAWSAAAMGGGVALWYLCAYGAGPRFYGLIGTGPAFGLMCAVTAGALLLAMRSRMLSMAVLAQVGAYLTPLVLGSPDQPPLALMIYLLVIAVGFLAVADIMRWGSLIVLAEMGSILVLGVWFVQSYNGERSLVGATTWSLLAVLGGGAVVLARMGRVHRQLAAAVTVTGAAAVVVLWPVMDLTSAEALTSLLVLDAAMLACWLVLRVSWCKLPLLGWSAILTAYALGDAARADLAGLQGSGFIWAMMGLLYADAIWRGLRLPTVRAGAPGGSLPVVEGLQVPLATGLGLWATYALLSKVYPDWMGLYVAGMVAVAIAAAIVMLRAKRPVTTGALLVEMDNPTAMLGQAWLVQGLVLLAIVAPVQWDGWYVTVAWLVQAVATALVARLLRSALLMASALALVIFGAWHLVLVDWMSPEVQAVLAGSGQWTLTLRTLLGGAVLAAGLTLAGIIRLGGLITEQTGDTIAAGAAVAIGCFIWLMASATGFGEQVSELAWLAPAIVLGAAALWRRSAWVALSAGALVAVAALKVVYDVHERDQTGPLRLDWAAVWNWQFATAMAVGVAGPLLAWAAIRRLRAARPEVARAGQDWLQGAMLLGVVMLLWAGSVEVWRHFMGPAGEGLADARQAMQMGMSVWWAVGATGMLVAGLVGGWTWLRVAALVTFAVTLAKVLAVDMAKVDLVYRVVSFLALGALLVAGSYIYQRHFKRLADLAAKR